MTKWFALGDSALATDQPDHPMKKFPDMQTPEAWHRHFAVEANNQAWDMSESTCTLPNPLALLNVAHASAWHWQTVGTELNLMRSLMLLALAHARASLGPTAWHYAQTMKSFFLARSDTPDWELAFVHIVHALAARANGDPQTYMASSILAQAAMQAIKNQEDREIVEKTYRLISPG